MILKTLTRDQGISDVWNYYDNIESVSVYSNDDGDTVVALNFKGAEGIVMLIVHEEAYLLNDHGKTIERIMPAKCYKQISPKNLRSGDIIKKGDPNNPYDGGIVLL